jgi:hypothetical protein
LHRTHPDRRDVINRKLALLAALILALGVLSGGIAIAAGGGAGPQAGAPAGSETGQDDDGAEAEDADARQDDDGAGEKDADESLTGSSAEKAANAALEVVGGGTVLGVERDDGNAGYEVEIRKADGSEAEVQLDTSFNVRQSAGGDD